MFFGKKQTGFINQPPAVNMMNQPGMMPGVPATGYPQDAFAAQPGTMLGVPAPGLPMEGFAPDQAAPEGMFTPHHMGYVCEPCDIVFQPEIYVVQKGDTVYKIAQKYGLDWRELAGYNRLGNPDLIYPGERLFIPPRS